MPMYRRFDKNTMAQMNRKTVIDILRMSAPINKAEIARRAGLSVPTVMKIVDEFDQNDLIRKVGKGESSAGKKPELLELVEDAYYIVGVDMGRSHIKVIVMDMAGRIVTSQSMQTGNTNPPEQLIKRLLDLIQQTIEKSGVPTERLLGLGIGMPGLLDRQNGVVLFSPDFAWENVQLIQPIQQYFQLEIEFENSNRALGMGERWFGAGQYSEYFICVNLGHGIGSAIVEHGKFYRGTSGSSGEIGHMTLEPNGPPCTCGNHGCLEALASGNAIARQARELICRGKGEAILAQAGGDLDAVEAKEVFAAARIGDAQAQRIVQRAAEYIGIALASYINLLDPDLLILSGGMTNAGEILLEPLEKVICARRLHAGGGKFRMSVSKLGRDGTAIGAASLILKKFIERGATRKIITKTEGAI